MLIRGTLAFIIFHFLLWFYIYLADTWPHWLTTSASVHYYVHTVVVLHKQEVDVIRNCEWIPLEQTERVQCCRTKADKCFFPHFKLHLFRINTLNVSRILRLQSCNKTQPCRFRPSRTDRLDLSCFLKTTDENKNQRLISFQCYAICRMTDGAAASARVCVKQITWLD